ncbi:uncharacterized protein LOC127262964 isoform X2 [Andrographis paniculata]|uniref:uncharacterized protein LOC127262964 isoform X2 n=1 Tax=Andrographis paniculata TaxID=175694 RepID=UPI0021E8BDBF|nr:uncharacterized protein LOC127262964 isoform X2 [Andrographis paniculata]
MVKDKNKKQKKKRKNQGIKTGRSIEKMKKVETSETNPPEATVPDPSASQGKNDGDEILKGLSGFIFMCNSSTKLECYRYRVFGLPYGQKEVVAKIKPGAKLFLYDFELKLLYGVYEATSAGQLNLEPAAFRGRFPAQVNFKIFKECFPLPETILRFAIRENYKGSKFKQELSEELVKTLISKFHPLNEPLPPHSLEYASLSLAHPLAGESQFTHSSTLSSMEPQPSYPSGMHRILIPAFPEHQPVSNVMLQHGYHHRPVSYGGHGNFSLDGQSLPSTSVPYGMQDPRSRVLGERAPPMDAPSLRYPMNPSHYGTSVMPPPPPHPHLLSPRLHPHTPYPPFHQLHPPRQPENVPPYIPQLIQQPLYGTNAAAYNSYPENYAQYDSSGLQPPSRISYQFPPQEPAPYGLVPAFNPQYTLSSVQPQAPQTGIPQGSGHILTSYSNTAANQVCR